MEAKVERERSLPKAIGEKQSFGLQVELLRAQVVVFLSYSGLALVARILEVGVRYFPDQRDSEQ